MDKKILSIIDANINRALEGLRVCEDYFRFNARLSQFAQRSKELRHLVKKESSIFPGEDLLAARDIAGDLTKFIDTDSELSRSNEMEIFSANIHRAIEALRSIEEFSKVLNVFSNTNPFQEIRFMLYEFEKDVRMELSKIAILEKFHHGLYAILDSAFVDDNDYRSVAEQMIAGGAAILQLRMKNEDKGTVLTIAKELAVLCREKGAVFIVNDHVDVACLVNAHGVHLGQTDIPVAEARKLLPTNSVIGISTHNEDELHKAYELKPDYIALGPLFDTTTKNGDLLPGIGFSIVSKIAKVENIPLVAIGGIKPEHVKDIVAHGYDSFAVISALYKNNDYKENCRQFVEKLEGKLKDKA